MSQRVQTEQPSPPAGKRLPTGPAAAVSEPRMGDATADLVLPLLTGSSWPSRERSPSIRERASSPALPECKSGIQPQAEES